MAYASDNVNVINLRAIFQQRNRGVLAPASGGCSQYTFGAEVKIRVSDDGQLELLLPRRADGQQEILQETTLSLRVPVEVEPDGTELTQLILAGDLDAADASIPEKWQCFHIKRAHFLDISGTTRSIPNDQLALK
ncbi:MAG: hypothetical protein M5U15_01750 [Kiritimatiellae bacterium]|nr:hypothetical protein [Kiritimatiellia bacterium]